MSIKNMMILLLLVLLFSSCKDKQQEPEAVVFSMSDTMMAKCSFSLAEKKPVMNEIRLFGKITADNNKQAQVYPIVSGIVKKIQVELGDYVKQGQVLASIQSSEVASFQKQKLDAINDVAIAEKNLQVIKDLFEGKLSTEKDVSAAERELEKAKAELSRINEVYSIYNLRAGSIFNVTAPISGFVVTKNINQNELLRPDNSEPVFSIAEINEVWALANVNETDISKIYVGYAVTVNTLAFPDRPYHAKIDKIFNAIDPETKSMKVRVKIPNPNFQLKPEMNCNVIVQYAENKDLVSVPSSSIIFDKGKYWVMVFKDRMNVETRRVEIYRQLGDTTYLKNGLDAGENVISGNGILIYDALND